jgi:hypothetical protein
MNEGVHRLLIRRTRWLTGAGNTLNMRPLASRWPAHAITNLRRVHIKLCEGTAQSIPVHTKLFGGFALVSFMVREHFEDIALLELTYGFHVGNAGAMHLRDQTVQFALQSESSSAVTFRNRTFIVPLPERFDPMGRIVLELSCAIQNLLLKVMRYNEGYRMRPRKEIGR